MIGNHGNLMLAVDMKWGKKFNNDCKRAVYGGGYLDYVLLGQSLGYVQPGKSPGWPVRVQHAQCAQCQPCHYSHTWGDLLPRIGAGAGHTV